MSKLFLFILPHTTQCSLTNPCKYVDLSCFSKGTLLVSRTVQRYTGFLDQSASQKSSLKCELNHRLIPLVFKQNWCTYKDELLVREMYNQYIRWRNVIVLNFHFRAQFCVFLFWKKITFQRRWGKSRSRYSGRCPPWVSQSFQWTGSATGAAINPQKRQTDQWERSLTGFVA